MSRIAFLLLALAALPLRANATVVTSPWNPKGGQAGAAFGTSVAPAGDVNGDGYPDVLVGAPLYDNGEIDEGRAYLYLGSANGLPSSPSWTFEPNQAGAHAGAVVAGAGDVNADGYGDVLIAAPLYDRPGHVDAGVVFVFQGGPSGLPAVPNATLFDDVTGSLFGTSVATAGDVNADFAWDVIVGAPGFANGQANEGAVYVFKGGAGTIATTPWLTYESNEVGARAGWSVSGAGDVNGDQYADVIFGLPGSGPNERGKAIVLKGSASGLDAVTPLATFTGNADSVQVGFGVSLAGDVDADGYADVMISRPGDSGVGFRRGVVAIYRGQAGGVDPSSVFETQGSVDQDRIGAALATAGDLDGDGYADFVIGKPKRSGLVQVMYGGHPGQFSADFLVGAQADAGFGAAVATSGDFDNDGNAELLVGVPGGGVAQEGAVFAYSGRAGPLSPFVYSLIGPDPNTDYGEALAVVPNIDFSDFGCVLVGAPGAGPGRVRFHDGRIDGIWPSVTQTIDGALADGAFGAAVVDAGDVNRDGYSDFVIGSPGYSADGLAQRGRALLFLGGIPATQAPWIAEGEQANDLYAAGIGARGDVNGDGFSDVIVGSSSWNGPSQTHTGKAYLHLGGPGGLANAPAWTKTGTLSNENFGYRIALLDFDGDGYTDAAISAAANSPQVPRVDIFYGGPSGLAANAAFSLVPSPPAATYGSTVANVGDWNGDGTADLVVAATDESGGGGFLYLYPGSHARSQPTQYDILRYTGPAGTQQLGYSIAGGFDLDGDGLSDFVAGAPNSAHPESNEGRLFVFRGRLGGSALVADTTLEVNIAEARLGTAVGMGDVNGDGYADIVASLPGAFSGGAVYGWYGGGEGAFYRFNQNEPMIQGYRRLSPGLMDDKGGAGFSFSVRSAGGRARVLPRFEIHPTFEPFTRAPNKADVNFGFLDTGAPWTYGSTSLYGSSVAALVPNIAYHWRAQGLTRSPYFPHTRWMNPETRTGGDFDFRTGGSTTGVSDAAVSPGLARPAPNPSFGPVSFAFEVPGSVRVRLAVYDLKGRLVRTLADEPQFSGKGARTWDGTDARGMRAAPGLYFVELRAGDRVERARFVRID